MSSRHLRDYWLLIGSLKFQPRSFVKVMCDRGFLQKRVIEALMVNGRWLWPTIRLVVDHDEFPAHCSDLPQNSEFAVTNIVQIIFVFVSCQFFRMGVEIVAEHEYRTESA